ncbi:WbuC family cupin fold metalloprotein [Pontivivens ytuae]|nr:WbuC family cupin fold metalloprotein [Pontivivens ytuae]
MTGLQYRQVAPEVFYSDGGFRAVTDADVAMLRSAAETSPRRRARLCLHDSPTDTQQEMVIVMHEDSYVRPHRHSRRVETLGMIEGHCTAVLFHDDGSVYERAVLSAPGGGGAFFYRMPTGRYHTLLFDTRWTVFVETTIGPFDPSDNEGAPWAPAETDPTAGAAFLAQLRETSPTGA